MDVRCLAYDELENRLEPVTSNIGSQMYHDKTAFEYLCAECRNLLNYVGMTNFKPSQPMREGYGQCDGYGHRILEP
jgi:hypothetical protein